MYKNATKTTTPFNYKTTTDTVVEFYSWIHQNMKRQVLVIKPAGDVTECPYLFTLHPLSSNGTTMANITGINERVRDSRFIAILPYGIAGKWNDSVDNSTGVDDVGFIKDIINNGPAVFGGDNTKVYFCGYSNGGFMSARMASELTDSVKGVATVAATIRESVVREFTETMNFPVMMIHGTGDTIVPYAGSGVMLSVDNAFSFWQNKLGCERVDGPTHIEKIVYGNSSDNTDASIYDSTDGSGAGIRLIKIDNGGHNWPGANSRSTMTYLGQQNDDFNAMDMIIDWFGI